MPKRKDPDMEVCEDLCEICGKHVGFGIRLFHLGRCDEHAEEEAGG